MLTTPDLSTLGESFATDLALLMRRAALEIAGKQVKVKGQRRGTMYFAR